MTAQQTRSYWKSGVKGFYDEVNNSDYRTGVWADCPLLAIAADPSLAHVVFYDFNQFYLITDADPPTLSDWTCAQAGSEGGLVIADAAGGVLQIDSECTTQHRGIQMQQTIANFKCAALKDIWFEARLNIDDTATTIESFVGLAALDTTLSVNGDLDSASSEYIGFGVETTAAGVNSFYMCKATAEVKDSMGTAGTFGEDTWIRLGFHVDGITGIHAFIDGVEVTLTNVVYTSIPVTAALSPSFVCQGDSTNDVIMNLDWFRCVQLR